MKKLALVTLIAGMVLAAPAILVSPAMAEDPDVSWVARDAGSRCDPQTGHVTVYASIKNTGDLPLTVTVTEVTFQGDSDAAVVQPGQSHTFYFDAGAAPLPGGQVAYHVEWDGGSADFTRGHSPTEACTTTTRTTGTETTTTETRTTTTEAGTSTTATGTTTPGGTSTSATSSSSTTGTTVSGTTATSPFSSTTTPLGTTVGGKTVSPAGTAFTGIENVVPLGALALTLMTAGSGALWAASRRRRHDEADD